MRQRKPSNHFLHRAIDRDWFDTDNEGYRKEKENVSKNLKNILNKNDPSFNQPFLKKFIADFKSSGIQILKKEADQEKNVDDITYNVTQKSFMVDTKYHNDNPTDTARQLNILDEYFDIQIELLSDLQKFN